MDDEVMMTIQITLRKSGKVERQIKTSPSVAAGVADLLAYGVLADTHRLIQSARNGRDVEHKLPNTEAMRHAAKD